eukprot:7835632-Pyramimonas_sp.AAC.1
MANMCKLHPEWQAASNLPSGASGFDCALSPVTWGCRTGPVAAVWIAPESGTWRLEEIAVSRGVDAAVRFPCGRELGESGEAAAELRPMAVCSCLRLRVCRERSQLAARWFKPIPQRTVSSVPTRSQPPAGDVCRPLPTAADAPIR